MQISNYNTNLIINIDRAVALVSPRHPSPTLKAYRHSNQKEGGRTPCDRGRDGKERTRRRRDGHWAVWGMTRTGILSPAWFSLTRPTAPVALRLSKAPPKARSWESVSPPISRRWEWRRANASAVGRGDRLADEQSGGVAQRAGVGCVEMVVFSWRHESRGSASSIVSENSPWQNWYRVSSRSWRIYYLPWMGVSWLKNRLYHTRDSFKCFSQTQRRSFLRVKD